MLRARRLICAGATAISLAGCLAGAVGPGTTTNVDLTAPGDVDVVRFVYLGSGGWIIERGEDQVLASTLSPARLEMTFPPKYGATALQYVWWLKRRSSSPATRTSS